jgi:hypothetical protein
MASSQGFIPQTSRMAMKPPSGAAFSARSAKKARTFSHAVLTYR